LKGLKMTIEVVITHNQPGYDKSIDVIDGNGLVTTIRPGKTKSFWIHDENSLIIEESTLNEI